MKTILTLATASITLVSFAQPNADYPRVISPWEVVAAGPHDRLWQSVTVDAPGVTNVHAYTEVGTGLNFWDGGAGAYRETVLAFQLTPAGYAVATNGQHQLIVSPDIAAAGAVDFLGPDGQRLLSNPLCLAFRDAASGQETLIASVTNCQGQLTAPNMVTFPQAFAGLKAGLNYTYRRDGIEQDVILCQRLPEPEGLGLDPTNTFLEIWTEFFDPPPPVLTSAANPADQTVEFGQTRMDRGYAYLLNAAGLQPVALQKTWTNLLNRYFLIESVPYRKLKPLLNTLQAGTGPGLKPPAASRAFPDRRALVANGLRSKPKPLETAAIRPGPRAPGPALVLDYQTLSTSQSNYVFAADMTYYVSSPVTLSGTPVLEGGTVIKLAPTNSVGLYFPGANVWGGTNYRPTLVTGRDDNNVGETITGSTGVPTNYYGAYAFKFNQASTPGYLRISYAKEAFQCSANSANLAVSHAQIVNCQNVLDNEGGAGVSVTFHDVLLYNDQNVSYFAGQQTYLCGEQVTMDQIPNALGEITVTLTNSLLTAAPQCGGTSNKWLASSSGVYQTVGAGSHYLAASSPYRGAGTTNLAASVMAYLSQRTTWPPWLTNAITANTVLGPQAPRDLGPDPDLGYHYDPLDYCMNGVTLTNGLTLTNGVALGMYGNYGINLGAGADLVSQGAATTLNRLVRFASVQELSTNWGNAGSSSFSFLNLGNVSGTLPQVWLRFTDLSFLANTWSMRYILNNNSQNLLTSLVLRDCTICGGALS